MAAIVDAVHEAAVAYGLERDRSWSVREIDSDSDAWTDDGRFLHIQAAWHRIRPEIDSMEGLSVWGSGLGRGSTTAGLFEVVVRAEDPALVAAMVGAFLAHVARSTR